MNEHQLVRAVAAQLGEPFAWDHDLARLCWKHGSPFDIWMYMGVLWPNVCEFDGMVFLPELATTDVTSDEIARLLEICGHDRSEVEKRVNRVEVAQLFGRNDAPGEMDMALEQPPPLKAIMLTIAR